MKNLLGYEVINMKYSLLLLTLLSISLLSAIVVNHIPPSGYEIYQQQELRVEIMQGWADISEAQILYKFRGEAQFTQVTMIKESPEGVWLSGYLPVASSADKVFEYYFKFILNSGAVETLPVLEAESRPFILQPKVKPGELSEDFILLSEEGSVPARDGYVLAISWYALEGMLDVNSIKLFIKGKDYTKRAEITSNMLMYKNELPTPGVTTAFVTATTLEGKKIYSQTWTNVIKASGNITQLPLNLRGSVNAGTNVYSISKDVDAVSFGANNDDGWASLDMYGEYKKLQLQSYTYLSTLEDEDIQHVDRFRLGILLPFWETYVGDYSPDISSLTMSNKNLRGVYSKLYSKYIGFSFAHGEMIRSIKGEVNQSASTPTDTKYYAGTFKQEALGARLRLGMEDGFSLGINTTRNRDIISSLDKKYVKSDTTQIAFPHDNLVFSMDAKLSIPAQNIILGIEGAASLYNNNILNGPIDVDSLESYIDEKPPINPADFQDFFIINTNMQPLPMSADFDPNSLIAWQAYLRNFWLNNLININYSEVGASFRSLSTNYLQSDVSQFSISDQYNYRQYAFLSGGFNRIADNLSKNRLETNIYNSLYLQGMFRIPRYPYLTASYTTSNSKNEHNTEIDSVDTSLYNPYKRKSNMISFGIGYEFDMLPIAPTTLDLGWRTGFDNEKRPRSTDAFVKFYDNEVESISLSLISRFIDVPLKTQIAISNNMQERKYYETPSDTLFTKKDNGNFNLQLKGEYRLFENMLVPWAEYRTTLLGGDQEKQTYNYISLGADARPIESVTVSTSLGWQIYSNKDIDNVDYTTTAWRLNVSYHF